jgi:hypothetical protein
MTVEQRQNIERRIVRAFVRQALAAGYYLVIDNGGDNDERITVTNEEQAMAQVMATDNERIYVYANAQDSRRSTPITTRTEGCVWFVYGNTGWDVIADYSVWLEELGLLKDAEAEADKAEKEIEDETARGIEAMQFQPDAAPDHDHRPQPGDIGEYDTDAQ